jgi:pimeloyl-ACP methyl ester carboxylesterase
MILGGPVGFERFDRQSLYGGAIALFIAARHPERVRSLLLVDNALPSYGTLRRQKIFGHRRLAGLYVRTLALRTPRIRAGLEASYADDRKVTPELVRAYRDLRVEASRTLSTACRRRTAPSPTRSTSASCGCRPSSSGVPRTS